MVLNFTENNKKFCLSVHYNGVNSYLFVNGIEIIRFKAKDSEIVTTPLRLGNISKEFLVNNMKKTRLNGYVYDFSADYDFIKVDDVLHIHKYLWKKNDIIQNVWINKNYMFYCNDIECKKRAKIIDINNNEPLFYNYSTDLNKRSGSCNNINDQYSTLYVPDFVKNINFKVFNLISRNKEARHIKWHETCKCKCRLDVSACNNK